MKNSATDKEFKKIALNIGTCMLIFVVLFYALFYLFYFPISENFSDDPLGESFSEILYGFTYLTIFIIPALIYRLISRKTRIRPLRLFNPVPRTSPLYLFLAISVGFTCSYITSMLFSLLDVPEAIIPTVDPSEPMAFYQFLLAVFTTAIVPAICEEFLFRSTILENLIPYGKGFAIITSALLFGLMHQNIFQIFYTTMAGIIIGYAYYKTRSYLCVFLIHFCNNFFGVIQEYLSSTLSEITSTAIIMTMESVIFIVGIIAAIILAVKERARKDIYAEGSFGKLLEPSDNFVERKISFNATKTFFLSPTVLIFTIVTVISMIAPIIILLLAE